MTCLLTNQSKNILREQKLIKIKKGAISGNEYYDTKASTRKIMEALHSIEGRI